MKIGIDLDGVCYGFTEAFCDLIGAPKDFVATKWRFFEDLGFSEKGFLDICRYGILQGKLFKEGNLLPGTGEAFDALIQMGHEIHLVTDRCSLDPEDGSTIINYTRDWLEDNGLRYETIHFTGDKATVAKELELDFFIDDRLENYYALEGVVEGNYLFERPWNMPPLEEESRIRSWDEFVQKVALESLLSDESCYEENDVESPLTDEVRVTSTTGGQKGQKLARIGSLDPLALLEVAKVAGFGEKKYSRLNYMNGFDWSLTYDAGQRHRMTFWSGEEDFDPESGLCHLAHSIWQDLCLLTFWMRKLGTDDRYRPSEGDEAA